MNYPMLFHEADIPIPEPAIKQTFGLSRAQVIAANKAAKALLAKMQVTIFDLLARPALKMRCKAKNFQKVWEDAKAFTGSVTIIKRNEDCPVNVLSEWGSAQLHETHCWVFLESLEALKEEGNAEEKLDILDWIFSPSFIEKMGKTYDGRPCLIRRHAQDIPFSFVNCARAVGIQNTDDFREMLVEELSDEYRQLLSSYLTHFTGKKSHNLKVTSSCKR